MQAAPPRTAGSNTCLRFPPVEAIGPLLVVVAAKIIGRHSRPSPYIVTNIKARLELGSSKRRVGWGSSGQRFRGGPASSARWSDSFVGLRINRKGTSGQEESRGDKIRYMVGPASVGSFLSAPEGTRGARSRQRTRTTRSPG